MPLFSRVTIHSSQFPDQVQQDLLRSFQTRALNHKFLYDSLRQTQKWLALHEACSPARRDPQCAEIYDAMFEFVAGQIRADIVNVISLGCGGGQKDVRLLAMLKTPDRELHYTPCDVSTAMVLVANNSAGRFIDPAHSHPVICDLATARDLPELLNNTEALSLPNKALRIGLFFGMLPNFDPHVISPLLSSLLRPGELLLLSANLAPGSDYSEGVQQVLPQYDNPLTRDWLFSFLAELGVELQDGEIRFQIESDMKNRGIKRIAAYFHFVRSIEINIHNSTFAFQAGDVIRLFFSYRHTPALLRALLEPHGLELLEQWITPCEEEGVFVCRSKPH